MPTARELLEQADALMRRNRARDELSPSVEAVPVLAPAAPETVAAPPAIDEEIPELTDVAPSPDPDDGEPPRRQALGRELATAPS